MKIEVLVTTMHQTDISKYSEMNLQTDAVIANQADVDKTEVFQVEDKFVKLVTTNTRGLSINRNIAMLYSNADIIVFADDDQVFVDGYEKTIIKMFEKLPDADAIKFYCESTNPERPMAYKRPNSIAKANKRMLMPAGVHGLAVKREFLLKQSIYFNPSIGSGQNIICGEDTVFYSELCKKGANIYAVPDLISYINQGESSWFKGYTEQYFTSVGYVYDCVYGFLAPLAIVRRAIRIKKSNQCTFSLKDMVAMMLAGNKKHRSKH